jgi:hypothetical protein
MTLRRGFKSDANWYSTEMRRELSLRPASKLCPRRLADHLGYRVVALSEFARANPRVVSYFGEGPGQRQLSGITLPYGEERWIIYNDGHDPGRQAADIAHECAHGLLNHPLPILLDEAGRRRYDLEIEEEANWLGPALLISDAAALFIVRRGYQLEQAAELYGVSVELLRFRINVTSAARRVA